MFQRIRELFALLLLAATLAAAAAVPTCGCVATAADPDRTAKVAAVLKSAGAKAAGDCRGRKVKVALALAETPGCPCGCKAGEVCPCKDCQCPGCQCAKGKEVAPAPKAAAGKVVAKLAEKAEWLTSYETAAAKAAREGKPLLVYVTQTVCLYCDKLDAGPLADPAVKKELARYVCVKVNKDLRPDLAAAYGAARVPLLAGYENEKLVFEQAGYADADALLAKLKAARKIAAAK